MNQRQCVKTWNWIQPVNALDNPAGQWGLSRLPVYMAVSNGLQVRTVQETSAILAKLWASIFGTSVWGICRRWNVCQLVLGQSFYCLETDKLLRQLALAALRGFILFSSWLRCIITSATSKQWIDSASWIWLLKIYIYITKNEVDQSTFQIFQILELKSTSRTEGYSLRLISSRLIYASTGGAGVSPKVPQNPCTVPNLWYRRMLYSYLNFKLNATNPFLQWSCMLYTNNVLSKLCFETDWFLAWTNVNLGGVANTLGTGFTDNTQSLTIGLT